MQRLNNLDESMHEKWPREENRVPEQPAPKNLKLMAPIVEKSYGRLASQAILIPECLYAVAKYNSYLPLAVFTERNLTCIHAHDAASFKMCKVSLNSVKQDIIVLKDLLDKFSIAKSMDRSDEGLTYPQFQQPAKNYYIFMPECDPGRKGGICSTWMHNHFFFFTQQPEMEMYYNLWKPGEHNFRRTDSPMINPLSSTHTRSPGRTFIVNTENSWHIWKKPYCPGSHKASKVNLSVPVMPGLPEGSELQVNNPLIL
ncbi:hypothetical protein GYMLUDRAFT_60570 [Collybiopsis luxurians FD-317 M1]|uniref:Uncharacterized protein n=1 Tax=Collybiopsis luxurians FD-317 M1 TaxID=944289 RepID=A0A0D0CK82_9AGAR|nr:hypothetical protein GYMLUDRAFT_60570 [Collybiopsis luxurians FD-317 M1]